MKKFFSVLLATVFAAIAFSAVSCGCKKAEAENIPLLRTEKASVYSLSGTDALNRAFQNVSSMNKDKYMGLFYFLWQGQEPSKQFRIYDNTELLAELGDDFWDGTKTADSMPNQYHYWGEPLFGYYNAQDTWVMKRHLEMLTFAGVDFLAFDTTNQFVFRQVWSEFLPIAAEFSRQGFPVPKITFYTNTDSPTRVKELYNQLYSQNLYPELWFSPNGKPLIIAKNTAALSAKIRDFFDFRSSQWPGESYKPNGFPWIDFNRDQHVYPNGGATGGTIVSVSVSQHPGWPFSDSVQYKDVISASGAPYYQTNWGRGYTTAAGVNDSQRIAEGANFAEQWQNALSKNPSTVFLTGWNEWIAVKFYEDITITTGVPPRQNIPNSRVFFVDTVNQEFSRDIEPMKGGYGDNYYMQTADYIRRYKGVSGEFIKGDRLTIDVFGELSQWNAVKTSFRDFVGDACERNFRNAANTYVYTDKTNRNDISEIRLAHDDDNLYALISAADDITGYESGDRGWMNLFIGVEGLSGGKFGDYNFVINRLPEKKETSVERSLGGYAFETVGKAKFGVSGRYIVFSIPKALLGISEDFTLKIKATDNISEPSDLTDY
ncbi:MAG: hypothetical protein J6Y43_06935, partial [Clostridia bacterium]|nr:hypothetical protein [Clostridia bacterium]